MPARSSTGENSLTRARRCCRRWFVRYNGCSAAHKAREDNHLGRAVESVVARDRERSNERHLPRFGSASCWLVCDLFARSGSRRRFACCDCGSKPWSSRHTQCERGATFARRSGTQPFQGPRAGVLSPDERSNPRVLATIVATSRCSLGQILHSKSSRDCRLRSVVSSQDQQLALELQELLGSERSSHLHEHRRRRM